MKNKQWLWLGLTIIIVVLYIAALQVWGWGIARAENPSLVSDSKGMMIIGNIMGCPFKINWNEKNEYLEIVSEKIHLRIHSCGRVEKLEWKEINGNEEKPNCFFVPVPYSEYDIFPIPGLHTMPSR